MSLRLSHVLVLMALILAAGVISAHHLQADVGASVPGLVVVRAGRIDPVEFPSIDRQLALIVARSAGADGARDLDPSIDEVPCDDAPFAPFDADFAARRAGEAAATVLVSAAPRDGADRSGWRVLVADAPRPAGTTSAQRAAEVAAEFVRGQTGVRAFTLALDLGPDVATTDLAALLAPIAQAAQALPRTRRTSLVILAAPDASGRRRQVLRLDTGAWGQRARPGLADLIEDAW